MKRFDNRDQLIRRITTFRPMLKNAEFLTDSDIRRELKNYSLYESIDKRAYAIDKQDTYSYGMEKMYRVSFTDWRKYARMLTYVEWVRYILFEIGTPIDDIEYYLENVVDNFNFYLSKYNTLHTYDIT